MKESELYQLVDEKIRNFDSVSKLRKFLENTFGDELRLPVVISPKIISSNPQSLLQIKRLTPYSNTSKLTVQNYLQALRELEKFEDSTHFNGELFYDALDSLHYSNTDSEIFQVRVKGDKFNPSFGLSCYFISDDKNSVVYEAVSKIYRTPLENICERFVGPNIKYEKRLI